jgi:Zn-dependent M28 family amino/carboxypeptidase
MRRHNPTWRSRDKLKLMRIAPAALILLCISCAPKQPDLRPAIEAITAADLNNQIKTLASDEFEGRSPGTHGEDLTVAYLTGQFEKMGLKPGNPDGTYIQKVPLVGYTSDVKTEITANGRKLALTPRTEYVASSRRYTTEVKVPSSDIVFVGYGVVAPEYGWDDYKGVDLKGKTILMLVNDPPVPDPNDPAKLDDKMFKGKAMTYYGRWTYKYEIASEKGAAAALIVHETGPAGYPFEVVGSRHGREDFDIQKPDKNMTRVAVEGWITYDKAAELCKMAGQDLAALKKSAVSKDFHPVALKAKASFDIKNTLREVDSRNVIAKLEGSDPQLKSQYVIYTAHWDHLGKDTSLKGDQVFNGANDNASGTAGLLELAQGFAKISPAPKRSILFLSVTAEERGLLGAKYYAENPLYPLKDTLADINMDELNQWGRSKDVRVIGLGNSTLDDVTEELAKAQGRVVVGDAEPEKGRYFRSDHFEFAKQGVPALYPKQGIDIIGKPEGYGLQKEKEYTTNDYHKVTDEIKPDWDLAGAVEDLQLYLQIGYKVAQADKFPEWKPGAEFKSKR